MCDAESAAITSSSMMGRQTNEIYGRHRGAVIELFSRIISLNRVWNEMEPRDDQLKLHQRFMLGRTMTIFSSSIFSPRDVASIIEIARLLQLQEKQPKNALATLNEKPQTISSVLLAASRTLRQSSTTSRN